MNVTQVHTKRRKVMNIDRIVLAFAGSVVLISLGLGLTVSTNWFILTGLMGFNLVQGSLSGFCPLAFVLSRLGVASGAAFCRKS
jgi:hypothetical protein